MTPLEAQLAGALRHVTSCIEEGLPIHMGNVRPALAAFDAQKAKWDSCGVCHGEGRVWLAGWEVCPCQLPAEVRPPHKVVAHLLEAGAALCGMPGVPSTWPTGHCWTPRADFREPLPEGWALCPACAAKAVAP